MAASLVTSRFSLAISLVAALLAAILLHSFRVESAQTPESARSPKHPRVSADLVAAEPLPAVAPATKEPHGPPPTYRSDPRSAGSPLAVELNAVTGDVTHDVETLHALLQQYLRHLHRRQGLPIGNDSDLARALTGHNPMHLVVIPPNHPAITSDGHLRDRWGTPYFIHPRGNNAFEIRSAGPDRKLFTNDDAITNPPREETDSESVAVP